MKLPTRIQRRRTEGFTLPPRTLCATRPGPWGNPCEWRQVMRSFGLSATRAKELAVLWFRRALEHPMDVTERDRGAILWIVHHITDLLEYDHIACWCGPDDPCHVDVLLAFLAERLKETT